MVQRPWSVMRRFSRSVPFHWMFGWDRVPEITLDLGLFAQFDDVFARAKRTMRGPMQHHRMLHRDDTPVGCVRIEPIMYGFDDFDTDAGLRQVLNVPGTPARNAGMSAFDNWHKSSRRSPAFVNHQTTIKRRLKRAASRCSAIRKRPCHCGAISRCMCRYAMSEGPAGFAPG